MVTEIWKSKVSTATFTLTSRFTDEALCLLASWNFAKGNFNKQFQFAREAYDSSHKRGDLQQKLHAGTSVSL